MSGLSHLILGPKTKHEMLSLVKKERKRLGKVKNMRHYRRGEGKYIVFKCIRIILGSFLFAGAPF